VTLMTFDKQSNARRTPVEWKCTRSSNPRHNAALLYHCTSCKSSRFPVFQFRLHRVSSITTTASPHRCHCMQRQQTQQQQDSNRHSPVSDEHCQRTNVTSATVGYLAEQRRLLFICDFEITLNRLSHSIPPTELFNQAFDCEAFLN